MLSLFEFLPVGPQIPGGIERMKGEGSNLHVDFQEAAVALLFHAMKHLNVSLHLAMDAIGPCGCRFPPGFLPDEVGRVDLGRRWIERKKRHLFKSPEQRPNMAAMDFRVEETQIHTGTRLRTLHRGKGTVKLEVAFTLVFDLAPTLVIILVKRRGVGTG